MKKSRWFFIVLAIVAIIIVAIIIINIRREKRVNHFEFPPTMQVENYTKYKRADTLAMIILNKIFLFDTIKLNIYYMNRDMSTDEREVAGFIQKNPFEPHSYNIFTKKGGLPISIKRFLSHELIHLEQMEMGDLIQFQDQIKIVFKGDTIYFSQVPYDERPYEIEAHLMDDSIEKGLNKLLYRK